MKRRATSALLFAGKRPRKSGPPAYLGELELGQMTVQIARPRNRSERRAIASELRRKEAMQ